MAQTSFKINAHTAQVLADLQKTFGVRTNAEVISSAVALARIVARVAGDKRSVVIKGAGEPDDNAKTIDLKS